MKSMQEKPFVATRNACKMCTPLGASIVFKGINGCVPLIHGSQGCSTYIRRYLISHYKEPVDIASTNFTEESAIFGGEPNLNIALKNITDQYAPKMIGIATTCLSETIGDDMHKILHAYTQRNKNDKNLPDLVHVNTPSYVGTHANGFHDAVCSLIQHYAKFSGTSDKINLFPGFVSPADLRMLKEIAADFNQDIILTPDYSNTLDYEYTGEYERIPEGGTPIESLEQSGSAKASIEFGYVLNKANGKLRSAGDYLEQTFGISRFNMGIPIGIKASDQFFNTLENLSGTDTPLKYKKQRGRLIDSYVDGHKYVFGKKAIVYGEEDFVVAITAFLDEIGVQPVLVASGGNSGTLKTTIEEKIQPQNEIIVHDNLDFEEIGEACIKLKPDILIGNSKGYYIARKLGIPLVRCGFPIHDRIGGQRIKHLAYEGTQQLFDIITNTLIEYKQEHSPVGYKYM